VTAVSVSDADPVFAALEVNIALLFVTSMIDIVLAPILVGFDVVHANERTPPTTDAPTSSGVACPDIPKDVNAGT
jgi:hypothetical protein